MINEDCQQVCLRPPLDLPCILISGKSISLMSVVTSPADTAVVGITVDSSEDSAVFDRS
jgi:hypothetical protein